VPQVDDRRAEAPAGLLRFELHPSAPAEQGGGSLDPGGDLVEGGLEDVTVEPAHGVLQLMMGLMWRGPSLDAIVSHPADVPVQIR
jgi:hypothetical protein